MRADEPFPDAPPRHAHSRVTDPERFWPLHALALDLLARISAEYDIRRDATFELLPGTAPFEHARPPLAITPLLSTAAPLAVAFTTFPGLVVRFGRWQENRFPSCRCDACRETADMEARRCERLVRDVEAGRFREGLEIPWLRRRRLRWWLGPPGGAVALGTAVSSSLEIGGTGGSRRWRGCDPMAAVARAIPSGGSVEVGRFPRLKTRRNPRQNFSRRTSRVAGNQSSHAERSVRATPN